MLFARGLSRLMKPVPIGRQLRLSTKINSSSVALLSKINLNFVPTAISSVFLVFKYSEFSNKAVISSNVLLS